MAFRFSTGLRTAMMGSTGFKGAMDDGKMVIFSGTIPADADATEGSGTELMVVTVDGGAFPSAGVTFDAAAAAAVSKAAAETWKGEGLATGTPTWFRFYGPTVVTGASTTAIRFDGTVGTSNADALVSVAQITLGADNYVNSCTLTMDAVQS